MSIKSEDKPRVRLAARAVLLNPRDQLLLMRFRGRHRWVWITLGGGLHPGEDPRVGVARELEEESGRSGWEIGPQVWSRAATFELNRELVEQRERYYLVRTEHFEAPADMMDEEERRFFGGFRWWSAAEIQATEDLFAPRRLGHWLEQLLRDGPPRTPIDVGR